MEVISKKLEQFENFKTENEILKKQIKDMSTTETKKNFGADKNDALLTGTEGGEKPLAKIRRKFKSTKSMVIPD